MKIGPVAYIAKAKLPDNTAADHIAVAYNLDIAQRYIGLEFSRVTSSVDDSGVPGAGHDAFSFTQELRLLDHATAVFPGPRDHEEDLIRAKLREAYGQDAIVTVAKIERET